MVSKRFLTIAAIAEETEYSEATIRRAIRRGEIPVIRLGLTGGIRIPSKWLDDLEAGALGIDPVDSDPHHG